MNAVWSMLQTLAGSTPRGEALDWMAPFRIDLSYVYDMAVTTVLLYALIVATVRVLGIRAISHFNNFDWIVTVAIGAVCGAAIVSPEISAVQGAFGVLMLFAVQLAITLSASKSDRVANLVKEEPRVLVRNGVLDRELLRGERLREEEVLAEVRGKGLDRFEDAKLVVLETDATVSVVPKDDTKGEVALQDVKG